MSKEEKLLEICHVAQRLRLDASTVRRMFLKGILKGIKTGAALKSIRIFESSVMQHLGGNTGNTSNTGSEY